MKKTAKLLLIIIVILGLLSPILIFISLPNAGGSDTKKYQTDLSANLLAINKTGHEQLLFNFQILKDNPSEIEKVTVKTGESFSRTCSPFYNEKFENTYSCSIALEEKNKENYEAKIETLLADGGHDEISITVPNPPQIKTPEILSPTKLPAQGESFGLSFKDASVDVYKVEYNLCHPYQNDGINPCLDGESFNLVRNGDQILLGAYSAEADIELKNGIITLSNTNKLSFTDSIEYRVTAYHNEEKDGINYIFEVQDGEVFQVE